MQSQLQMQIRENNLKICLFMAVLTVLVGIFGAAISYYFSWGLTGTGGFIIMAGIINFMGYYFSDKIILWTTGAKPLTRDQAPELYDLVQQLCIKNNLPLSKLYVIQERTMNAFATGRNYQCSVVAVTKGLLEKLTKDEVEGVIAHELAHIKNYDMRVMAIVSILAGFISLVADMFWTSSFVGKAEEKDNSGIFAIIGTVLAVFAPLVAFFIQLAISRKREFVADATGSIMTGKPTALASALRKISLDMRLPSHISSATAHLYFSSPAHGETFIDKLFSTHPPIEERITLLENM